jgi:hypothetical protein
VMMALYDYVRKVLLAVSSPLVRADQSDRIYVKQNYYSKRTDFAAGST